MQPPAIEAGLREQIVAARFRSEEADVEDGAREQRFEQLRVLHEVVRHDDRGVEGGGIERLTRPDDRRVPTDRLGQPGHRLDVAAAAEDGDRARRTNDFDQRPAGEGHGLAAVPMEVGDETWRTLAVERLDEHVGLAAAAQAEAEDDVVLTGGVISDHARPEVGEPLLRTFGEIALQASAADGAEGLAVLAEHRARAVAAVRRAAGSDDSHQDAALAGIDDGACSLNDSIDLVHVRP